ncbi:hypothetical protein [Planobispora longispora]|nr:hypothetical protein [Planobispora longispora]
MAERFAGSPDDGVAEGFGGSAVGSRGFSGELSLDGSAEFSGEDL